MPIGGTSSLAAVLSLLELVRRLLVSPRMKGHDESMASLVRRTRLLESEIESLRAQHRELSTRAATDRATGLMARCGFCHCFAAMLASMRRQHGEVTLIVLSIPGLADLERSFGPRQGKSFMSRVGRSLRNTLSGCDAVARVSSERFAALVYGRAGARASELLSRVEATLERIAWPVSEAGRPRVAVIYGRYRTDESHGGGAEEAEELLVALEASLAGPGARTRPPSGDPRTSRDPALRRAS